MSQLLLSSLSFAYSWIPRLRALLYTKRLLPVRRLSAPVISVGNLTLGGTGKTPFVAYLCRLLETGPWEPAVLTRGYGGRWESTNRIWVDGDSHIADPRDTGDEPFMLARQNPGLPIAVGKNRFVSGLLVQQHLSEPVFVLDDGFQHLNLERTVDLLLLDAREPFGNGKVIPAGRLREPVTAVRRADAIILTRCHLAADSGRAESDLQRLAPGVPRFRFAHRLGKLRSLHSRTEIDARRVVAISGIADPATFRKDLQNSGFEVAGHITFRDHHWFQPDEIEDAWQRCTQLNAEALVTTEKDAARMTFCTPAGAQILVAPLEVFAVKEEDEEFKHWLLARLPRRRFTRS